MGSIILNQLKIDKIKNDRKKYSAIFYKLL